MAGAVCSLCSQVVEPETYYRQLDCSRNCEDNVFHEACIEKYLRKNGRGAEQKTGFACPATLSNGKPCLGTIKKTHMRLPANSKKKELNKQAAIAVNLMVNTARVVPAPVVPTSKANPGLPQALAKAAARGVTVVKGQRPPTVVRNGSNSVSATAANIRESFEQADDDFSSFRPIGKRSSKRDDDECDTDGEGELPRLQKRPSENTFQVQGARPSKSLVNKTAASRTVSKTTTAVSAISKNSAMAPEPVVRQPTTIPGWTDSKKVPAGGSNLAQQRALVAALRAEGNASSANRASTAAVTTIPAGGASKNAPGTGSIDKAQQLSSEPRSKQADKANDAAATAAVTQPATPSAKAAAMEPQPQQQEQQQLQHDISDYGSNDTASPPESLVASLDTSVAASPASFDQIDPNDVDPDPIVDYDAIYSLDGNAVVQDKRTGAFMRMEDVYGEEPELIGFADETGAVTYYVVVRKSFGTVQQLQYPGAAAWEACSGGGAAMRVEPGLHGAANVALEEHQLGPMPNAPKLQQPVAFGVGMGDSAPSPVAIGEVEEAADLDELLALCLGN
ncbi:hypothetical protein PLESTB_001451300 [Pleodorina starrii]|uniref:Uncharacterized protein n=1 Tax=Pleodorina starrii TaxID=330485 RepID=A0A9W6F7F6_9CHLO|nr:hypothetical protein PLESTM_000774100 [Pleodorina starrii]GLC59128.1 hypothetical protein PLESTB_001451300 [Pleodorina starrii]GLC64979.1 hypothetical protein PLESTF_000232300 [Pleodorina starrii]